MNRQQITIFFLTMFMSASLQALELTKGSTMYISLALLSPGQMRFTQANVDTKAVKLSQSKGQYDNGQSSLAETSPIPVVLGPDNLIVLIDSHHECLAAQKIGDSTVPIHVVEDMRNLSRTDFFEQAQLCNYIYPYDKQGDLILLPETGWYQWSAMDDDPNRLFVSLTAWKYVDGKGLKDPNATQDPLYPLWKKQMSDKVKLAFIEFKIATVLYKAGLQYSYTWGTNPNDAHIAPFTEQARAVLGEALNEGSISPFDLIKAKTLCTEL